jgi:hypothetical protein
MREYMLTPPQYRLIVEGLANWWGKVPLVVQIPPDKVEAAARAGQWVSIVKAGRVTVRG